jgi:O-antigen/teichoic acid export membrane protein
MTVVAAPESGPAAGPRPASREDVSVLRGSVLFLVGRVLAMGVAMITQVLVVRHLSKDDFGSFAFALALAALIQSVLPLGLERADTRFLTLYDDDRDPGRIVGVVITELLVVLGTGALALVAIVLIGSSRLDDGLPPLVLLAVVATAPLMAADGLVLNVFAVFARPSAVFLRRYVLDPGLRLAVVLVLLGQGMAVAPLAYGYLAAGLVGSTLYLGLLIRLLRGVVRRSGAPFVFHWPGRPLFVFALPLLLSAVMYAATTSIPTIMLKALGSTAEVAEIRAVQPVAALILVVPTVFTTLFLPRAARLANRGEGEALRAHYWSTAVWVAVLAFPVVVLLVGFRQPVTDTLFGNRYSGAAFPLAIMALAFYANAAIGLNGSVLQVAGRLRSLTVANLAGLVVAVGGSAVLIPARGADGAALAIALALTVPQVIKQWALRGLSVGSTHPAAWRLWIPSALLIGGAAAMNALLHPGIVVAVAVSALAWLLLVLIMRRDLVLSEVLPVTRFRRSASPTPAGEVGPPVTEDASLPGTWQCVDWRFLSPRPGLGRIRVMDGDGPERAALLALGEDVMGEFDRRPADTVIAAGASGSASALARIRDGLVPGGRLKVTVTGPPPGTGLAGRLRPLPAWRKHLTAAGFGEVEMSVALPNLSRTSALVSVSDRRALRLALRRQPVRRRNRVAGALLAVGDRLGLGPVLCRQGVVVARAPHEEGRHPPGPHRLGPG